MLDTRCWILDAGCLIIYLRCHPGGIFAVAGTIVDVRCWILDGKDLFPLRRQANPPTGVIRKEPVPQLREG